VEALIDLELVQSVTDLYRLEQQQISDMERMGDTSAENLLQALSNSRQTSLNRFIYSLGIREVGEATALNLANSFGSLEALMQASEERLLEVPDIGPVAANHIVTFFRQPHNRDTIDDLIKAGFSWPGIAVKDVEK